MTDNEKKKSNIVSEVVQRAREHRLNGIPFAPMPLGMEDIVSGNAVSLYLKLFRLANSHEGQGEYITLRSVSKSFNKGIKFSKDKVCKAKDELVKAGYLDYEEKYIGQSIKGLPMYEYKWTQYYERRERTNVEKADDKLLADNLRASLDREHIAQQELFTQPSNIVAEVAAIPNVVPLDTIYTTRAAIRSRAKEYCGSLISLSMLDKLEIAFAHAGGTMTEQELQVLLSKFYVEDSNVLDMTK